MRKSEMLFKRYIEGGNAVVLADFIAGYNAALDEVAQRWEDGNVITKKWRD